MSVTTEKSGETSTLPRPELNPLINPLLAQNMGRWAQVYFTSPPEKRDQAVQDLVHELEAQNPNQDQRVGPSPASNEVRDEKPSDRELRPLSPAPQVQATLVRCHACGRKNLTTQKFCGMCGTRLGEESAAAAALYDDPSEESTSPATWREQPADHSAPSHVDHLNAREPLTTNQISRDSEVHVPRLDRNELSLFQATDDRDYDNRDYDYDEDPIFSTPPSSGSSGIVVGLLVVIAIAVALYLEWPKVRTAVESLRAQPAASSAPANENVSTQPAPTPAEPNSAPAASTDNPPSRAARAPARPTVNAAGKEAEDSAPALPRGVSRPPKPPSQSPVATGGGEELAIAQGYLNGTRGGNRNSAEAAKWLWKSIAKHNPQATLLLSDLYLKGDGVSKNCDQARILLDSAALQGVKSAGERLRNFQAFGCQ